MPEIGPPYGATVDGAASRVPEFLLDETSSPSLADAAEILAEEGAYVAGRLRRMTGRTVIEEGTDTQYILRGCVYDLVTSRLVMLRGRGTDELHQQIARRVDERLTQLASEGATGLGDGTAANENGRVATSSTDAAEVRRYIEANGSTGAKLAIRNRL